MTPCPECGITPIANTCGELVVGCEHQAPEAFRPGVLFRVVTGGLAYYATAQSPGVAVVYVLQKLDRTVTARNVELCTVTTAERLSAPADA